MISVRLSIALLFLVSGFSAAADQRLDARLQNFFAAPGEFSQQLPKKFKDPNLTRETKQESHFTDHQIATREYVTTKSEEWQACHRNPVPTSFFSEVESDSWLNFFEGQRLHYATTLEDMETRKLKNAQIQTTPWSGDFWPIARGILGARYFDQAFENLSDWLTRSQFIQKNPAKYILAQSGEAGIKDLSPSEKYDLLVGDNRQEFTKSQWNQGKQYYDQNGKVEDWMGICHGWSPASIMEPRPTHSISVKSYDQKWDLQFYPSEIKGLLSYSWANNQYSTKMIGTRCGEKNPKTDANGRIIDEACFDINPGTWHKLVVNQIGVLSRAFIIDATYDYEVWNQPVFGYSYSYFNPKTKKSGDSLAGARVVREDYTEDPYAKYRAPQTRAMVGVAMNVGYTVETRADASETDSPDQDQVRWVEYLYDLELDGDGNIIGGEWYQEAHPDFAWAPVNGARATAPLDSKIEGVRWTRPSIPAEWANAATASSAKGVELNTIAEALLGKAISGTRFSDALRRKFDDLEPVLADITSDLD